MVVFSYLGLQFIIVFLLSAMKPLLLKQHCVITYHHNLRWYYFRRLSSVYWVQNWACEEKVTSLTCQRYGKGKV